LAQAVEATPQIAPEVATDGVDEVLTVMLHRMHHRGHPAALTAPLTLRCEDTGRVWTLTPRPVREGTLPAQTRSPEDETRPPATSGPPLVVDRRHPQADQVSAPAAVLYQALWHRTPYDALHLTGDESRIRAFLASRLVP
jgi:hypothetical protein